MNHSRSLYSNVFARECNRNRRPGTVRHLCAIFACGLMPMDNPGLLSLAARDSDILTLDQVIGTASFSHRVEGVGGIRIWKASIEEGLVEPDEQRSDPLRGPGRSGESADHPLADGPRGLRHKWSAVFQLVLRSAGPPQFAHGQVTSRLPGISLRHGIAETAASLLGSHFLGEGARPSDCWKTPRQPIRELDPKEVFQGFEGGF